MSDLDRRRLMMGSRKIPDFIIFDGTLKAGRVLGKSYSSISSAGYINICGGSRTVSNVRKLSFPYPLYTEAEINDYVENTLGYGKDEQNAGYVSVSISKVQYHDQPVDEYREGTVYVTITDNLIDSSNYEVKGYLTIGNYDFNKYKKLKIQVSSAPGSGTLTILNGSNNNVLTQNIYSSREYSIDIKNLNAIYSLKFESSGKDGFNIRKIYLEG